MAVCGSCELKLKPNGETTTNSAVEVSRYDRLESQYLTTGDFYALQRMNTEYPMETRTLIEDVLKIGEVNDPQISNKFLSFYQDSVLQALISDAESQYANMDDINALLNSSFDKLKSYLPGLQMPTVYAQIGALDQSIIIGDHSIGISLDKYLGEDYPLYKKFYNENQLKTMRRDNVVPDCIVFYLISLYPMPDYETRPQTDRDLHMGKVMWVSNLVMGKKFFKTPYVNAISCYMSANKNVTVEQLLMEHDYGKMAKYLGHC